MSDPTSISAQQAREATARMFRSVRAGQSWVRAQEGRPSAAATACVPIKPGNGEPPIFMVPGAPGSILQLGPLAAAMPLPMPVYAIRPRGLEEGEAPCASIEEMAVYAIGEIGKVRAAGPYILVGYSAGGLVALEMAQRLTAAGHAVPFVVLLGTYPGKALWPLRCHAGILGRAVSKALRAIAGAPAQAAQEIARRSRSLLEYLAASGVKGLIASPVIPEGWTAASRRVHVATYNAGESYHPSRYAGPVIFVQSVELEEQEPGSPRQVWRKYIDDMEICRVPGTHIGMVEENAASTGAALGECLGRVLRSATAGSSREGAAPGAPRTLQPAMGSQQCP